jgi:hypothetical protein
MFKANKITSPFATFVAGTFFIVTVIPTHGAIMSTETEAPTASVSSILDVPSVTDLTEDELIILAFGGAATSAVTRPLNGAVAECRSVGAEYAASCAATAYKKAARAANKPDYRSARKELNNAAKKLERLVAKNEDKSAKKKKGKNGTYKAVKKAAVAKVNKEARKIISETETKLLRSSGSGTRKVHYQRIAKAVGSTKVIFRS